MPLLFWSYLHRPRSGRFGTTSGGSALWREAGTSSGWALLAHRTLATDSR